MLLTQLVKAPAQFAAALKQTNLRYVLSIEADPLAIHRLTYWLYAQLLDGNILRRSRACV